MPHQNETADSAEAKPQQQSENSRRPSVQRMQSQQSSLAKSAIRSNVASSIRQNGDGSQESQTSGNLAPPLARDFARPASADGTDEGSRPSKPLPDSRIVQNGGALSDTPNTTAPPSPNIHPQRRTTVGEKTGRPRPTTLDIPGLTRSRVSPDGKIAQRDLGSKLVIVMVGLPARGKSYITKKTARYLNWLQHDTTIFNVGERRRMAAHRPSSRPSTPGVGGKRDSHASMASPPRRSGSGAAVNALNSDMNGAGIDVPKMAAQILINGEAAVSTPTHSRAGSKSGLELPELRLPEADQTGDENGDENGDEAEGMDQSASFFDPKNREAAMIREQAALDALNELLNYILDEGGSVGILDATNSTLERREIIMKCIRERAGPDLNVLFMESICLDENLLEANMRLKLSGPDYRDKDPESSLADFKKRIEVYEKSYVSLGEYEERNNIPYVQMIDVGRKVISHQIKGFLSAQACYYLLNFNLAPRQIWICRHGQSTDNVNGRIGGDAPLSPFGEHFSKALAPFIEKERKEWEVRQLEKERNARLPPRPGDHTPPNPYYEGDGAGSYDKNFCVWTSMLKRSVQSAAHFDEDEYDIKQMRMLDELFSGYMEGMTYDEIKEKHPEEYERRKEDKMHYRYPGPGGEGYLDIINRCRPVIVELERMTDHVLLIGHRSVARVLLAYFLGLGRDKVTSLDVPLGTVYCLEPKPYGVDFKAFRYEHGDDGFHYMPDYELKPAAHHAA
ncbi:MAG: hypothetical protein M1831_006884 [Alyxoria varia]|nr:MAG: hypothetical protein M1831_006884 [Alyxoria varia]